MLILSFPFQNLINLMRPIDKFLNLIYYHAFMLRINISLWVYDVQSIYLRQLNRLRWGGVFFQILIKVALIVLAVFVVTIALTPLSWFLIHTFSTISTSNCFYSSRATEMFVLAGVIFHLSTANPPVLIALVILTPQICGWCKRCWK